MIEERDPSRIFSRLRQTPIPERLLDEVSAAVVRSLDAVESRAERIWLRAAAAWAAALVLAALLVARGLDAPRQPAIASASPAPGPVEQRESGGEGATSRVVELSVGDTQVVMIFDPRIEL